MGRIIFFLILGICQIGMAARVRLATCDPSAWRANQRIDVELHSISDGDTIVVKYRKPRTRRDLYLKVRFLGMDTPETNFRFGGKSHSQNPWGGRAKQALTNLLQQNGRLQIEFGENPCGVYGRFLGYVIKSGVNVNKRLVEMGLASTFCVYPTTTKCAEFSRAELQAKNNRVGFHNDPRFESPYDFRSRISRKNEAQAVIRLRDLNRVQSYSNRARVPSHERVFFLGPRK